MGTSHKAPGVNNHGLDYDKSDVSTYTMIIIKDEATAQGKQFSLGPKSIPSGLRMRKRDIPHNHVAYR